MSKVQTVDNTKKQLGFLFIIFCKENDVEKVKCCIKLGVNVNTVSEDGNWSGLTIAAHKSYTKLMDLLLSQPGIDVNLATTTEHSTWGKWTPLMNACYFGNHEIVGKLLSQVPDVNILYKDRNGDTALHLAARWGHSECLAELAKVPGLDWNCRGYRGWTPLKSSKLEVVRQLVPKVDVTITDRNGANLEKIAR